MKSPSGNVKEAKIREPKQKRSKETKAHIIKVARKMFSEQGYYSINTNQIAAKAGMSVGTFYSYFKDKKAILLEIMHKFYDHFWAQIFSETQKALPEKYELRDVLQLIVKNSFDVVDAEPDFTRLIHSMRFYDPDIRGIFEQIEKREVDHTLFLMGLSGDRIRVKDKEAAALITMKLVESVGLSGMQLDKERVISEVTDIIYYYFTQNSE